MKEEFYILEDLDCANCAAKIEQGIQKLSYVREASVSFATKMLMVDFQEYTNEHEQHLIKTIMNIEPDVQVRKKIKEHEHQDGSCDCKEHTHDGCDCGHTHEHPSRQEVNGDIKLYLQGLDCANCAMKIENRIQTLPRIKTVQVNFSTLTLQASLNDKTSKSDAMLDIKKVIKEIEPDVIVLDKKTDNSVEKEKKVFMDERLRLACAVLFFITAIVSKETSYGAYLFVIAFIFAGGKVVLKALRNILKGEVFDENFLMSIATIGAFIIGDYAEGVAVMLFYEVGELCQSYAVNHSRKSISSLMNIRADYANKIVNGIATKVSPEDVNINDIIVIKPGERVPLDGVLMEGRSSLDTSALTGESMPREVSLDDEILAGSVNLNGVIQVKVLKGFGESTVSRILELVENASSKKAPVEKFITKFARIYTPIVVFLAVLIAMIPPFIIPEIPFQEWLYRALTFLVVSCPCALVISIPLGLFAGIGGASRQGILIKGGNYLEALKDVDCVVFDKTGTLTKGNFKVTNVVAKDPNKALEIAAYGEYYSNHPIAVSIRKEYGKEIDVDQIDHYEEIAGNGVHVQVMGDDVLLGNTKLMDAYNISYQEVSEIGTLIHIASNGAYVGYLLIGDEVKETSKDAILALKAVGVSKTVMLTGDRAEVGDAVGKELGLDEVYSELLPQDKVDQIERILKAQTNGKKVAFVGDGINDAPVLARADLGVAMGGIGSDAAIEAADIVLMKDDPKALAQAIHISRKTKSILIQNITFSLGIKIIVLILTAFGYANMWLGVFADVGVTLIAIINSMRALRIR